MGDDSMNIDAYAGKVRELTAFIQASHDIENVEASEQNPTSGEVWRTHAVWEDTNALVIILNEVPEEPRLYHAVPVHFVCEYAGPDDVLAPRELLGRSAVICVGASMPVCQESLLTREAVLPAEWLETVISQERLITETGVGSPEIPCGSPYIDRDDLRWSFKEKIGEVFGVLQNVALKHLQGMEELVELRDSADPAPAGELLDLSALFPAGKTQELALAADDSIRGDRQLRSYQLISEDGSLYFILSEAEQDGFLALEAPLEAEGAEIFDSQGQSIGRIHNRICFFKSPADMKLRFELRDGISCRVRCQPFLHDQDNESNPLN